MSDAEHSEQENGCLPVLSSCFRRKKKASSQEATHHSLDAAPNAEAAPIKDASTIEQSDSTVSSQPPLPPDPSSTPRPTSACSVRDEFIESPDTTTAVSDLWSRAFQELDEKTRKWVLDISEINVEDGKQWATKLIALVREREEAYKDSTPKLKVGNREILWRDYANKTVTWLVIIGDIAVNFAPTPSPIIWSALKVFIKTTVAQCEDLVAIFGCAEKVLSLMRRGAVYEIVYLKDATSSTAAEDLEKILVDLYKTLLQLLAHALQRLKEGQGRQFLRALISPGEGAELVSSLSNHEQKLSMVVQVCGAVKLQEHQKLLQSLSAPLRRVDENVKDLVEHLQEKSLDEALDYISDIPVGEHHFEKKENRTPETCEWLLEHPRFHEWEESSCSSTLWLQGNIGTGKSFLTSKVIDRYWFDKEEKVKHDEGFAYFYCSRSDPARRDPKSIYQSYIRQLARINHYPMGMHKTIWDLYRTAKKEQRGLSIAECKSALSELLKSYPQTTLILDALDECEEEARDEIALVLHSLVMDAERPLKVYIASRREPDIERILRSGKPIEIGTADNKGDIEKYIEQEMRRLRMSRTWESVSEDVRDKVKRTITDQSDGMFRWAYLQWEQLKKFKTDQSILKRLGKLPVSLEQAYDEIYLENTEKAILLRAAKWVLCAAEPLSNEVLLWAIRLETQSDMEAEAALSVSSPITQSTLESICCNLIVRDSQLKVWKFPHASAAEYFEARHKDWMGNAHEDLAILLISYLIDCYSKCATEPTTSDDILWRLSHGEKIDLDDYLNPRHPLEGYAREYWVWHARKSSNHHRLSPILKRFLGSEGPQKSSSQQYQSWCQLVRSHFDGPGIVPIEDLFPEEKSIFGICALGLQTLLEGWWDKDLDVSLVNDRRMDLLSIAAKHGHRSLCSDLIDHGSDMTRTLPDILRIPSSGAIDNNGVEMAALFIKKGYNPNCHLEFSTLLCFAALHAKRLVEVLLEAGADPNIQCPDGCWFGCALEAAAYHEKMDVAKILIKHGADADLAAEHGRFGSPLAAAATGESLECIKLLIEHGANVNAQLPYGMYGSALAAAANGRSLEVVKFLIEHGAEVNAQLEYGAYGSALAAAANGSSLKVVKFLIKHGAEVNAQLKYGEYDAALVAALFGWRDDIEIVKYLVEEAGADASILSSTPRWRELCGGYVSQSVSQKARYLVEGGYVHKDVLADLGLKV